MSSFNENENILITGASSGIGKALTLKLNALGLNCIGVARNSTKLEEVKNSCKYPEKFNFETFDLSQNLKNISECIDKLVSKYSKFSGFCHCAGVLNMMPVSMWNYDSAIKDFNINLFSAIEIIKELSKKKNKQEQLNIVLMSSIMAKSPGVSTINYGIAKAAIEALVIGLTKEIGAKKIRINAVAPGGIEGEFTKRYENESGMNYIEDIKAKTPFKQAGQSEYIADLIEFLLSKESYWIQGQTITIDGAQSLI